MRAFVPSSQHTLRWPRTEAVADRGGSSTRPCSVPRHGPDPRGFHDASKETPVGLAACGGIGRSGDASRRRMT